MSFIQPGLLLARVLLGAGLAFLASVDNRHNLTFDSGMLVMLHGSQLAFGIQVLVSALLSVAATLIPMKSDSLVR